MLKQRIITAIILLALVSSIIFLAPLWVFQAAAAVALLAAVWEWGGLLGDKHNNLLNRSFLAAAVVGLYLIAMYYIPMYWVFTAGAVMAVWAFIAVAAYNHEKNPVGFQLPALKALACILLITPTMMGLVALRASEHGSGLVFYALTLAFVNDSAAYFSGRWIGKKRLAPLVSPKKTWEGCICGILASLVWSVLVTITCWPEAFSVLTMVIIAIPTLIAAVIGDLFISVLKREAKIKDTGSLLPGHGGLLDRIDAVIMAVPVFSLLALQAGFI